MPTPHAAPTRRVLTVLLLAGTLYAFTQTLVGPALPALAERLDVSTDSASWLFTGFLLSASVATPLVGRLGDTHDRGRVLAGLLVVFALGGLVCAATDVFAVVMTGRVMQGVAGGVFPLAFGVVKDLFPAERVGPSIGLMGTTFGVGGGLGLPLSGVLVDHGGVVLIFLSAVLALPIAVGAWLVIPRRTTTAARRPADWPGTVLLSAGLSLFLLGLSRTSAWGLDSPVVLGLMATGLLLLALLVKVELGREDPLLDVRVLRSRAVMATNAATLLVGMALFANFVLTPQFAQVTAPDYGFGYSVTRAGALMLPGSLVMLVSGPAAGRLATHIGSRAVLVIGGGSAGLGLGLLALWHSSPLDFVASGALLGIGSGFALAASATLTVSLVDASEVGVATGINTVARTVGGSLGSVLLSSVLAASVSSAPGGAAIPSEGGFVAAYALGGVAAVLAGAMALLIPARRQGAPADLRDAPVAVAA